MIAQAVMVGDAVRYAMNDAGITDPKDIHYVQVKGPLLTPARIQDADARGATLVNRDGNRSKPLARGILAPGVALALEEISPDGLAEKQVLQNMALYSEVASTSVGGEVTFCEIVLMGNTAGSGSALRIGHDILSTLADAPAIARAHQSAGGGAIKAIFAKAEPISAFNGCRTTMMSDADADADVHAERHARAALRGLIAAATGRTAVFISGGTEHQCPSDAAPLALICEV